MIQITYISKTHTATLELERDIGKSGMWIPDGTVIRIDPPQDERSYQATVSTSYEPQPKTKESKSWNYRKNKKGNHTVFLDTPATASTGQ